MSFFRYELLGIDPKRAKLAVVYGRTREYIRDAVEFAVARYYKGGIEHSEIAFLRAYQDAPTKKDPTRKIPTPLLSDMREVASIDLNFKLHHVAVDGYLYPWVSSENRRFQIAEDISVTLNANGFAHWLEQMGYHFQEPWDVKNPPLFYLPQTKQTKVFLPPDIMRIIESHDWEQYREWAEPIVDGREEMLTEAIEKRVGNYKKGYSHIEKSGKVSSLFVKPEVQKA